jgi:hypothetical protein
MSCALRPASHPVIEVLREKHPKMREPDLDDPNLKIIESYPEVPLSVPLDITAETMGTVASKLSDAAGPSGTDAMDLSNWLLRHGAESQQLHTQLAALTAWIVNHHLPCAAYWALVACRLVTLHKDPGTCPVGIGEVYLFASPSQPRALSSALQTTRPLPRQHSVGLTFSTETDFGTSAGSLNQMRHARHGLSHRYSNGLRASTNLLASPATSLKWLVLGC